MEKELCTKFCGALISSYEVMKLQSFESGVSEVITANVQNISPLFFLNVFDNFMKKVVFTEFYGRFDHFSRTYEVAKF